LRRYIIAAGDMVDGAASTFLPATVSTAKKGVFRLDAVADDLTAAVGADRGQLVYRAFERVEYVPVAGGYNFER